ncbi:MAG: hypothetical protein ICV70_05835 [Jiangellaceae bacterium]|nr:hypothetical protein [Jiangellaceae bacterium]
MADQSLDQTVDKSLDGRTELRVHGVSGTPPGTILGHPDPLLKRIAGDARAGFFRRWYPGGRSADLDGDHRLEAYSWGGLTSGPAARAAWLLLLPLMLANLAHWMLPATPDGASRRQVLAGHAAAILLRLFGLVLTLTMLLTAVLVAVDLVGWQCGRIPRCASSSPLLAPLTDGFLATPGRRVALTAVFPLLVVLLVGLVGRRTPRTTDAAPDRTVQRAEDVPLARGQFWHGNPGMPMLRTTHVAAATALLAVLVAWPATKLVATGFALVVGAVICLGALGIFAYAVVLNSAEAVTGRSAGAKRKPAPMISVTGATLARRVSLLLVAFAIVFSAWDFAEPWQGAGRLPGLRGTILTTFAAGVVILALLTVATALQRPWAQAGGVPTTPETRPAMRGLGGPAVATIAYLVAGGFSAGITYRVAELLGYPVLSQRTASADLLRQQLIAADAGRPFEVRLAAATAEVPIVVPPSFAWAGAAASIITISVLVIVSVVALALRRRLEPLADEVLMSRPEETSGRTPKDPRVRRVALVVALASLTEGLGKVVGRVVIVSGLVLLAALVLYAGGEENWRFVEDPPLATLTTFGTWIMGLFAVGMVVVAWRSYRNPALRRTVGILWDVGSFFPRTAHPLAPPSYGERAVPDLVQRVEELSAGTGSRVVLSGHSQGSVLVAATMLQLPPQVADRVDLLTHGSPLRRLYGRFFPAYLGPDALRAVYERVGGRWRNLYRDTDPIGAWALDPPTVAEAPVDRRLLDPRTLEDEILGHSDYWTDAAYARALAELAEAERAGQPATEPELSGRTAPQPGSTPTDSVTTPDPGELSARTARRPA